MPLTKREAVDGSEYLNSIEGSFWAGSLRFKEATLLSRTDVGKVPSFDIIWRNRILDFDANGGSQVKNTMAGHAVATDSDGGIRPYNISMIPIIVVS